MSIEALRETLDELDERTWTEGTSPITERLAIALPDGDVGAMDDPRFVDWLLAHAELAPFGHGNDTLFDPSIRNAQRLVARGQARVVGFDPAAILGEIEQALSPSRGLSAELTDVLVYPTDGRFARHRDTPYTPDLVGTLVVQLPIKHVGGAFVVDDGFAPVRFEWGQPIDAETLRWVALFSDVDHAIEPVTWGARVTLVYALNATGESRRQRAGQFQRLLTAGMRAFNACADGPIAIACARHVVTDAATPLGIDALRGIDRELADYLLGLPDLDVTVRACMIAQATGWPGPRFAVRDNFEPALLEAPLDPSTVATLHERLTFVPVDQIFTYGGPTAQISLAHHILPDDVRWVIRARAAATLIHACEFSDDGYFGNGGFNAHLYTLAALVVRRLT
jgi:hypothetical protein